MSAVTARIASAFDGLFDWWVQELSEACATAAERYSSLRSPRFQLQLFKDHAVLARIGDATGEQQPFKLHENGLPPLDEIWTAGRPSNARIDLVLPEADVLVFHLQMPPMADHELKDAVELQLERKLPLARERLYVDWATTQKNPDRSRTIAVATARRACVDQWRDQLRPWAWRPGRVSCRDLDGTVRFNLLPRAIERVSLAFGRREALLAWAGFGLAVCYCLLTAGQWTYERTSLAENIEQARMQVAGVRELRAILERESKPLIAMRQLAQAPAADSALAALSATLPENTWLYQAEISAIAPAAPVITMEGYAPSAATLVQVFEQAQLFEGIQLVEASAAESELNRIKLKAQLQPRARP